MKKSVLGCPWNLVTIRSKLGCNLLRGLTTYLYRGYNPVTKYHGHPSIVFHGGFFPGGFFHLQVPRAQRVACRTDRRQKSVLRWNQRIASAISGWDGFPGKKNGKDSPIPIIGSMGLVYIYLHEWLIFIWLVVSTHLKNNSSTWESSSSRGESKKYLKPPPSWNIEMLRCHGVTEVTINGFRNIQVVGSTWIMNQNLFETNKTFLENWDI